VLRHEFGSETDVMQIIEYLRKLVSALLEIHCDFEKIAMREMSLFHCCAMTYDIILFMLASAVTQWSSNLHTVACSSLDENFINGLSVTNLMPCHQLHAFISLGKVMNLSERELRWGAGMVICLERGSDLHIALLIPLPLTISCSSKFRLVLPKWFCFSGFSLPRLFWKCSSCSSSK